MRFAICPLHLSKLLRLPRKSDARSYEVLHLSRKIISANLRIWRSKMQPFSGNQRPDLLTALKNMSLVLHLPRKMHLCRSSSNAPRLPSFLDCFWKCYKTLTFCSLWTTCAIPFACHAKRHLNVQKCSEPPQLFAFWLGNVLRATTACTFSTSQLLKVLRCWSAFNIFTSKFKMCFTPQRRALFRHLNFQKRTEHGMFCAFWLGNVLRATTACTVSTSQLLKVLWSQRVLYILTWKCASHHNGVQFFISHLASWLRTRRFSEPTFRPSGATNHWKTWKKSGSRLFYLFMHLHLLSSDSFSFFSSSLLWLFPPLLFICPYCRKFDF